MDIEFWKGKYNALEKLQKVKRRISKNEVISDYYRQFADETGVERYNNNASRLYWCSTTWVLDIYEEQKVRDLIRTSRCRDRFCANCQNALAVQRAKKYEPVLKHFSERYDVYHIVFTIPNPSPDELPQAVDRMYKQIGYIMRLFRGDAKIKGYDFKEYRFLGAIRALEITKGKDGVSYHPHFHCLFLFRKGVKFTGANVNAYSFDNVDVKKSHHKKDTKNPQKRYFTDFEVLLQKVWRLRYDGVKVTQDSINALQEGYSVVANKAKPKDYKEVFKYATKGVLKKSDKSGGYVTFETLMKALENRRIIQGYGVFRSIDFEMYDEQRAEEEKAEALYNRFTDELRTVERPGFGGQKLSDIVSDAKKGRYVYISKRTFALEDDYETT